MSDKASNALNYLDTKIHKVRICLETYINKFGEISNATVLSVIRTTENEVIRACSLPDTRTVRNNLRMHILDKLSE